MPPTAPVAASVDVGTIRHRFNYDWTVSSPVEDIDTYWWWARSVRVDPNEVWADDDEGGLWVIPFATDGADEITFGEPVRSIEVAVPVAAGAGASATAAVDRRRQRVLAASLARPDKPAHPDHPQASTGPEGQEEPAMPDLSTLRAEYGIGDDVTDEELADVLRELAPTGEADPPDVDPEQESTGEPVAASAAGAVNVEPDVLARLQADAAAGREAREQQRRDERDTTINQALSQGRITPARRDHWVRQWDADPDGVRVLLTASPEDGGLAPGTVPVTEKGHATGADREPPSAYPTSMLSARERARLAQKES